MKKTIIAISGKSGSGKTTMEQYLLQNIAGIVESYPMASMLKRVICSITGCTIEQLDNQNFKRGYTVYYVKLFNDDKVLTYRELMLHISKKLRWDNDLIFIEDVIRYIQRSTSDFIIIPDVRELNEMIHIKKMCKIFNYNLITILIENPNHNTDHAKDKTETDLDNYTTWDFIMQNNKDLNSFYQLINNTCDVANIPLKIDSKQTHLF